MMLLIQFPLFALSACARTLVVNSTAESWEIEMGIGQSLCMNSTIPRSIYVIGAAPPNLRVRRSEGSLSNQEFTQYEDLNEDNTIFFAIPEASSLEIYTPINGTITVSSIGLGPARCTDGIAVTNYHQLTDSSIIPVHLSDWKCIFFALHGEQDVTIDMTLKPLDQLSFQCGSKPETKPDISLGSAAKNCPKSYPTFTEIKTTNEEGTRSVEYRFEITDALVADYPIIIQRQMTPTPEPTPTKSPGLGPGGIAGITIGVIAFIAIFVVLVVLIYKKKKEQIEDETSTSNSDNHRKTLDQNLTSDNIADEEQKASLSRVGDIVP